MLLVTTGTTYRTEGPFDINKISTSVKVAVGGQQGEDEWTATQGKVTPYKLAALASIAPHKNTNEGWR